MAKAHHFPFESTPFESTRIPIDCSIKMRFDHLSGFEEHYAANISMGGMFIKTKEIYTVGTVFEFDFDLEGGQHLIQGTAEVLWRRVEERGPDLQSGIGVRFLTLDLDSKYVIYSLVDQYIQHGGTPFDLATPERAGKVVSTLSRIRTQSSLRFALKTAAVVAVGFLLYAILPQAPPDEKPLAAHDESRTRPEGSADEAAPGPLQAEGHSGTGPTPGATKADEQAAVLETAIHGWARTWSEKDVARYLSFYSEDFQPTSRLPLPFWRDQRRARLSRPGPIQVEISSLEIELVAPRQASARFDQAYSSVTYQDRVKKKLELRLQHGEWKILREEVVEGP